MSPAPEQISFAALTALVRSSVEAVAATEPDPGRSRSAGSTSPTRPPSASRARATSDDLDARLDDRRGAARAEPLEGCVLALCAAPELHPRYGRLYGYLHDDLTRRLPSPRLIARLLEGAGFAAADVLACFDRSGAPAHERRAAHRRRRRGRCRSPSAARRPPSG